MEKSNPECGDDMDAAWCILLPGHDGQCIERKARNNSEKSNPLLLDWVFVSEMIERMSTGAKKHPDADRPAWMYLEEDDLLRKLLRHVVAYSSGEKIDADTNQSHLVAIACNAMMVWGRSRSVQDVAGVYCGAWHPIHGNECTLPPHHNGQHKDDAGMDWL